MIKMMITVVVIFALLWLPLNTFIVVTDVLRGVNIHLEDYAQYLWFAIHWLAMTHACVNPFIYCYMNSKFRNGFRYVFRFLPCCRVETQHSPLEMYENGTTVRFASFSTYTHNQPNKSGRPGSKTCQHCLQRDSSASSTVVTWKDKGHKATFVCRECSLNQVTSAHALDSPRNSAKTTFSQV